MHARIDALASDPEGVRGKKGRAIDEVIAALEPRLARFKLPKQVVFVPALPRNAMGKVQKALLREAHA